MFARTRNYLVDPPGEENPENPELAITGERDSLRSIERQS